MERRPNRPVGWNQVGWNQVNVDPAPLPQPVPTPTPLPAPIPEPAPVPTPLPAPIPEQKPTPLPEPMPIPTLPVIKPQLPIIPMPEPETDNCPDMVPAMSYVKRQTWNQTYEPEVGFDRGTIFPELDLPFLGEGECPN